jgi:hypothetical protein
MRPNIILLTVLIILTAAATATSQFKKYDIKSGIVTFESVMKMGDFQIKKKIVLYFDDYGMKECRETYSNNRLEESYFSDGKTIYSVKHKEKAAYKRGPASRGTELRVEWSEFGTDEDRAAGKYKKLSPMKIAGKNCEMIEYNDKHGTVTTYGGWSKIMLYMKLKTKDMESVQKAVKIEENAAVPADKFRIPAGYSAK